MFSVWVRGPSTCSKAIFKKTSELCTTKDIQNITRELVDAPRTQKVFLLSSCTVQEFKWVCFWIDQPEYHLDSRTVLEFKWQYILWIDRHEYRFCLRRPSTSLTDYFLNRPTRNPFWVRGTSAILNDVFWTARPANNFDFVDSPRVWTTLFELIDH